MRTLTYLVALVATLLTSNTVFVSTAEAANKSGILPQDPADCRNITKKELMQYVILHQVPADIMSNVYNTTFKSHVAEYAAIGNQQIKQRIQQITGSSEKMSDSALVIYVANGSHVEDVGATERVTSTAVSYDAATGQVFGHTPAKIRNRRMTKDGQPEQKLVDNATGAIICYLTCVNTFFAADDESAVITPKHQSQRTDEEGDEDESTTKTVKTVHVSGDRDINVNVTVKNDINNTNKNDNTNTNKNDAGGATRSDGGNSAGNIWGFAPPAPPAPTVVYPPSTIRNAGCSGCGNTNTNGDLAELIKLQKRGNRIAGVDLGNDILTQDVPMLIGLIGRLFHRQSYSTSSSGNTFGSGGDAGGIYTTTTGGAGGDAGGVGP